MNTEIDIDLPEDKDELRTKILSMSFEDLQKLKENIGIKKYNDVIFTKTKKNIDAPSHRIEFKRANKNRPRERSSKKPTKFDSDLINDLIPVKKNPPRDPRFDPLCGTYDAKVFKKSYKFLDKVKLNEQQTLKDELKNTDDPKRKKKIKFLLQRLNNQLVEKQRKEKLEHKLLMEKQDVKDKLKRGEKPEYRKKSEKKIMDLLDKYKELKQNNQLKKHIEKKSKKATNKDRHKMNDAF